MPRTALQALLGERLARLAAPAAHTDTRQHCKEFISATTQENAPHACMQDVQTYVTEQRRRFGVRRPCMDAVDTSQPLRQQQLEAFRIQGSNIQQCCRLVIDLLKYLQSLPLVAR
jgi:hypothetical protein